MNRSIRLLALVLAALLALTSWVYALPSGDAPAADDPAPSGELLITDEAGVQSGAPAEPAETQPGEPEPTEPAPTEPTEPVPTDPTHPPP